ncbi:STAS/SEC14 domain-containing protein [Bdellovibrio bacteriovorus]|uniref:STAS/SEC14 domain-containing protein n=1 Tax=Bdellovibrio bacteriovorus TaxID=959 RepID=UPI0021D1CB67|nr:STAS/SEC14 domain-containing protein [Bdellovibrio bacteriovorus]UXR65458.1 STAS/SEC14 domain-containing protein [Bdellovibrio bacteriovorus]
MLKVTAEHPKFRYIEILVDGDINADSVTTLLNLIQKRIEEWGEVNILEEVRDIGKVELAAFWKDLRFGIKNLNKFPKAAIVTDIHWVKNISNFLDPIVEMDIEVFTTKERDIARAWLAQGDMEESLYP